MSETFGANPSEEQRKEIMAKAMWFILDFMAHNPTQWSAELIITQAKRALSHWQEAEEGREVGTLTQRVEDGFLFGVGVKDANSDGSAIKWLTDMVGAKQKKEGKGISVMFISPNEPLSYIFALVAAQYLAGNLPVGEEVERFASQIEVPVWLTSEDGGEPE